MSLIVHKAKVCKTFQQIMACEFVDDVRGLLYLSFIVVMDYNTL